MASILTRFWSRSCGSSSFRAGPASAYTRSTLLWGGFDACGPRPAGAGIVCKHKQNTLQPKNSEAHTLHIEASCKFIQVYHRLRSSRQTQNKLMVRLAQSRCWGQGSGWGIMMEERVSARCGHLHDELSELGVVVLVSIIRSGSLTRVLAVRIVL